MMRILTGILVTLSASPAHILNGERHRRLGFGSHQCVVRPKEPGCSTPCVARISLQRVAGAADCFFVATPVPIAVPVAKGDSNIWPLFDNISAPSSGQPEAGALQRDPAKSGWLAASALPRCCSTDGSWALCSS